MSLLDYDRTTKAERDARKSRALKRMEGKRGAELTPAEKQLLQTIREIGYDIQIRTLIDPAGNAYPHRRTVVKGGRSWSHSMDT